MKTLETSLQLSFETLPKITTITSNLGLLDSSTILSIEGHYLKEMDPASWQELGLQMVHKMLESLDGIEALKRSSEKIGEATTTNMNAIFRPCSDSSTTFCEQKPLQKSMMTLKKQ